MEKIIPYDQGQSLEDGVAEHQANSARTQRRNGVVTFPGNNQ
ncbi:hypothetical protein [Bradyrhizobium sacchari]|uniref:Uncharacterized protein n=1 Tax=Bradyrhizobium sacchari TaxID=1399419 RepID=A0A560IFW9_9BRAD|nr:hypothetical protein [Bradyrhizobium sacchari]TWB55954.1 hypothetical protein FBZ94_107476 [Bradyrhizobium sacchari]TWB78736.1 hypothetical protein FBZ95_103582 [Bradyrhizobium sacchari]